MNHNLCCGSDLLMSLSLFFSPRLLHMQEHTRVGSSKSQDIQLCGMAIQAEHCIIDVTQNDGVVLTPHRNARYVLSTLFCGSVID